MLTAAKRALTIAVPTIWNHGPRQPFHQSQEVQISMGSKGRALDNILTERSWRSVRYEEGYLHDYAAPWDAYRGLARYFTFYYHYRLHQALGYATPASWFTRSRTPAFRSHALGQQSHT